MFHPLLQVDELIAIYQPFKATPATYQPLVTRLMILQTIV